MQAVKVGAMLPFSSFSEGYSTREETYNDTCILFTTTDSIVLCELNVECLQGRHLNAVSNQSKMTLHFNVFDAELGWG